MVLVHNGRIVRFDESRVGKSAICLNQTAWDNVVYSFIGAGNVDRLYGAAQPRAVAHVRQNAIR